MTYLFIGLGNPGNEYTKTRHNIGFLFINWISEHFNTTNFQYNKKFNADITEFIFNNNKILLIKPQTYMNLSGNTALSITTFYKINKTNTFILHDDNDLNLNKIQIISNNSNAGHNGIKSIDNTIGKGYWKIRIGINNKNSNNNNIAEKNLSNFVLSNFHDEEINKLQQIFNIFITFFNDILIHHNNNTKIQEINGKIGSIISNTFK